MGVRTQKLAEKKIENEKEKIMKFKFSARNIFLASQGFNFEWKLKASDNIV